MPPPPSPARGAGALRSAILNSHAHDWLNKNHAVKAAQAVPYRLLEAESVHGDANADNWLIQGDD